MDDVCIAEVNRLHVLGVVISCGKVPDLLLSFPEGK